MCAALAVIFTLPACLDCTWHDGLILMYMVFVTPESDANVNVPGGVVCASLQDISSSLPVQGTSSRPVPLTSLQAFSSHLQQLVLSTVQACSGSIEHLQMDVSVETAEGGGGAVAPPSGMTAKWQQTAKAAGVMLPLQQHQQIAAEFGRVLGESVLSEEGQLARWCSLLVQSRQLGRSIAGLMDSMNEMLAVLPWVQDVAAGQ